MSNAVEGVNMCSADVADLLLNIKEKNEELSTLMEKVSRSSVDSTGRLEEFISHGAEPSTREFQNFIQNKVIEMMQEQLKSETEMANAFDELERNARKIKITLNDRLGQDGDATCIHLMNQVNNYHASISVAANNWKRVPTLTTALIKNLKDLPDESGPESVNESMGRIKHYLKKHHEILRRVAGQSGVVMPPPGEPASLEDVQAAGWLKMNGK